MSPLPRLSRSAARAAALALAAAGVLLAGCASPARMPAGTTAEAAVARLGRPTAEYPLPGGGRRLQYSEMPSGSAVWNMDYDAAGKLVSVDQALRYDDFNQIVPGQWRAEDVTRMLGQPMRIEHVASFDGPVWTYRFNDLNNFRRIHIHIDRTGVVRSFLYTDEIFSRGLVPF